MCGSPPSVESSLCNPRSSRDMVGPVPRPRPSSANSFLCKSRGENRSSFRSPRAAIWSPYRSTRASASIECVSFKSGSGGCDTSRWGLDESGFRICLRLLYTIRNPTAPNTPKLSSDIFAADDSSFFHDLNHELCPYGCAIHASGSRGEPARSQFPAFWPY